MVFLFVLFISKISNYLNNLTDLFRLAVNL